VSSSSKQAAAASKQAIKQQQQARYRAAAQGLFHFERRRRRRTLGVLGQRPVLQRLVEDADAEAHEVFAESVAHLELDALRHVEQHLAPA
jgi:hypothetical protein